MVPLAGIKLTKHREPMMLGLNLTDVLPTAWLSTFGKWLPFEQLVEVVPFLAASGLPGFLAITIVILTSRLGQRQWIKKKNTWFLYVFVVWWMGMRNCLQLVCKLGSDRTYWAIRTRRMFWSSSQPCASCRHPTIWCFCVGKFFQRSGTRWALSNTVWVCFDAEEGKLLSYFVNWHMSWLAGSRLTTSGTGELSDGFCTQLNTCDRDVGSYKAGVRMWILPLLWCWYMGDWLISLNHWITLNHETEVPSSNKTEVEHAWILHYMTWAELSWQIVLNVLICVHCLKEAVTHFSQVNVCFSVSRPKHGRPTVAAKIESLRTHKRHWLGVACAWVILGLATMKSSSLTPCAGDTYLVLQEKLAWHDGEVPCLVIHVSSCSSCVMMFNT